MYIVLIHCLCLDNKSCYISVYVEHKITFIMSVINYLKPGGAGETNSPRKQIF